MKWIGKLQAKLTGLTDAIVRFPLTTLFLVGAAAINASTINAGKHQSILLVTFVVGAFLSLFFRFTPNVFLLRLLPVSYL